MTIDILTEKLLLLRDVPRYLADLGIFSRDGRVVTIRTVTEWVARGLLEATPRSILNTRYTSKEAIARMFGAETPAEVVRHGRKPNKRQRPTRHQRDREHGEAMKRLQAEGVV